MPRSPLSTVAAPLLLLLLILLLAPPAAEARRRRRSGQPVPGQYMVIFETEQGKAEYEALVRPGAGAASLASRKHPISVGDSQGELLRGVSAPLARRLRRAKGVKLVQDRYIVLDTLGLATAGAQQPQGTASVAAADSQSTLSWGIDRIDQQKLPLNQKYTYNSVGQGLGATVYVVDSGIRTTHTDFGGRAVWGTNLVGDGVNNDGMGHGTHVAGLVGGTTWGVAKQVTLVAVKVFDSAGVGTLSSIINGINWAAANCGARYAAGGKRCVINLSLGGPADATLDNAVQAAIAAGVTVVAAAGNERTDACSSSPARVSAAITVGATDRLDSQALFSNYGGCLDLYAPGDSIYSAWPFDYNVGVKVPSDTNFQKLSGTSMAAPHVAGVAAIIYSRAAAGSVPTPASVRSTIVGSASKSVTNTGAGSPQGLLYRSPTL